MQEKRCACCGGLFRPRPQAPQQMFCAAAACQRERRRRWQQERRQSDADYRENQARAQRSWAQGRADYWRAYRLAHPQYVERNRTLQRGRDAQRRGAQRQGDVLAKKNASTRQSAVSSGTYRLTPASGEDLAKMDGWMVEITVISTAYVSP